MEKPLLRDPQIIPTAEVLDSILGCSYPVFDELMKAIADSKYGLVVNWNYYRDGNVWLCKVVYKKKTIFWLSVWDGYFKTGFYFTEKNCSGIFELDIDEAIKIDFNNAKHIGKLIPLAINIEKSEQLKDLLVIVDYKKSLK